MKIHGDSHNPHWWALSFATCPVILLDGQSIDHVREADDVEGYVIVEPQEDGWPKFDEAKKKILTERINGKVEFIGDLLPRVKARHS